MKSEALIYVPSDTPEAMVLATRNVAGVPVMVRSIMTLAQAGITRATLLVAESQQKTISKFLRRYKTKNLPRLTIFTYDESYRINQNLLADVTASLNENFLLINTNLLFNENIVKTLRKASARGLELIGLQDGVQALPFMNTTRSALASLDTFIATEPRSFSNCICMLQSQLQIRNIQNETDNSTFLLNRLKDIAVAEKFLAENIRFATTGPVAKHLNKRISLPISMLLSKMWISPHAITTVNIIIGLFSGVFIADGQNYWAILFGAFLFQTASVADGCDGEVAKLTFRASRFGQFIDTISDNLALLSLMIGLIAGYWQATQSSIAFWVGGSLLGSAVLTVALMIRVMKQRSNSASLVAFDKDFIQHLPKSYGWLLSLIGWGKYLLKKDLFSLSVLAFAIVGKLYWWLYIATFVSMTGTIIIAYLSIRETLPAKRKQVSIPTQGRQTQTS